MAIYMKNIKRTLIAIILLLSAVISVCGMTSCNQGGDDGECKHKYSNWGTLVAASCFEEGYRSRYCTLCGEVQGEDIPPEHRFDGGVCTECGMPEDMGGGDGGELDGSCNHVDADGDRVCDLCDGNTVVIIDFYALNDLHGKIFDTDAQPGVDELTTYIKNAYETDDNVVVLSSGDMWQGSSESNLTHGNMMTEWMMELGTVSMTYGNHEFDWSNSYIYENLEIADFPFLAINIYDTKTGTRVDFAEASVVVERGGAKIGIIGAIGDCLSSISGEKTQGIEFKVGSVLTSLVKAESERLRSLGCDVIVYSIHDGLAVSGEGGSADDYELAHYYDTALSRGYVDVVFEGHTHHNYVRVDSEGIYHIQGGGENDAISHVELMVDVISDDVVVRTVETVESEVYDDCDDDDIVEELRAKYAQQIAKADEHLGRADAFTSGNTLRQLCAELYLEYGLEEWGADYGDIVLAGGYIGIRSPYDLYAGDVYYKDIYSLFPFDNALCLCTVSGYKLLSQFINSTNSNYFISYSDYGSTVKDSINSSDTYYVITDTYSAYYSYNGLTVVDVLDEEIFARDMIAEYIKGGGLGSSSATPDEKVDLDAYDIKSIAAIKAIIDTLPKGVESDDEYYVYVTISEIQSQKYGNCTVYDDAGGEIFVYGLKDESGSVLYQNLSKQPIANDKVLLLGRVMYYVNASTGEEKYEIINAKVIAINPES